MFEFIRFKVDWGPSGGIADTAVIHIVLFPIIHSAYINDCVVCCFTHPMPYWACDWDLIINTSYLLFHPMLLALFQVWLLACVPHCLDEVLFSTIYFIITTTIMSHFHHSPFWSLIPMQKNEASKIRLVVSPSERTRDLSVRKLKRP